MKEAEKNIPSKYESIFWIEVEKIKPNPYQPRRSFDEESLKALADSIRQYGVLQPLVVTRRDKEKQEGGLESEYELIAGERRLRASKLVGLRTVPAVIRTGDTDRTKLELAIIENLQREDLNAIDRAQALQKLVDEFGISHVEVAIKIGRSREYVANSIRLLALPEHIQQAVVNKEITEGHGRTLLSLNDRPEERDTLFKEILLKKLPVRTTERIARSIANEKARGYHRKTADMVALEKSLTETLGTRVMIETNEQGGRLTIEFFTPEDLSSLIASISAPGAPLAEHGGAATEAAMPIEEVPLSMPVHPNTTELAEEESQATPAPTPISPPTPAPAEEDLYSVKGFSV